MLLSLLWPEAPRASAQNNLRYTLSHLRSLSDKLTAGGATRPPLLMADRQTVQIHPAWVMQADVNNFQHLLDQTRQHGHSSRSQCPACQPILAQAVALYQQEYMAGFGLDECAAFEEWLFVQREQLYLLVCEAYSDLADYAENNADYLQARAYAQRQIELNPLREAAYRQQMRILARLGERSAALTLFARCRSLLSEELGLDPEPETLALHTQLLHTDLPLGTNETDRTAGLHAPAMPSQSALPAGNLPNPLTPFIGREDELDQLQKRLTSPSYRLISIVGPGGVGKTRLALQVAGANQHRFAQGVCFAPLAGVQDAAAIPAAIMDALHANFAADDASPAQQLLTLLEPRQMLLVIDNFEHLMAGVDLLLTILQRAPQVTLLVTTREQLNCQAEDVYTLNGLATPAAHDLAHAGRSAAVRLFCDRAHRITKDFKLTAANCGYVVQICRLVEGMPLAIELITTWLRDFDCADLAALIANDLSLLATTQRDLPVRHRSMEAVFAHSWQLLKPAEQAILSRLAVCQGRLSASAAQTLAGASLIDLAHLRYKSLLRTAGSGYYEFHPLLRHFALQKLDAHARAAAEARHAAYYLRHVAEQAAALAGGRPQVALQAISRELDNVHQAWQWAVDHGRTDLLLEGAAGLGDYYAATGRNIECEARFLPLIRQWIEQPNDVDELGDLLCMHLLDKVCHSLIWLGRAGEAQRWAQTMLGVAQRTANREYEARALVQWGKALDELVQPAAAAVKYGEALTLARQLAHWSLIGLILIEMSHPLRDVGKPSEAEAALRESLEIQRDQGNRLAEQRALLYLAVCKREAGDLQADRNYLIEAMELTTLTANRHVETRLLDALGYNHSLVGDYRAALAYHEESSRIAQEINQPGQVCHALRNMSTAHRKLGNLALAEEYGLESLRLALLHKIPNDINLTRLHLGYVWLAAHRLPEATTVFQLAYASWDEQHVVHLSQEALVGLATVELHSGKSTHAAARIAPLAPSLLDHVPIGVREAVEMHLACYEILAAVGDARANAVLSTLYVHLQNNAGNLTDQQLRHSFWQAPAHHKVRALWRQTSDSPTK